MQNLIRLLGILIALCSLNLVHAQIDINKLKELKDKKMESSDPFRNLCFIDGLPDINILNDSINHFSIGYPRNYKLTSLSQGNLSIIRFESIENEVNEFPVLETKILEKSIENLESYFDKTLAEKIGEKSLMSFGNEKINGHQSFWIESLIQNMQGDFRHQLSYYLINPLSQKIFIISIKSNEYKRRGLDFCAFGPFVRQLKWIK